MGSLPLEVQPPQHQGDWAYKVVGLGWDTALAPTPLF